MKSILFLAVSALGLSAHAIELDGVLCNQGKMSYRYEYQSMKVTETVNVMPGVTTGEVRYEQLVKEQNRNYKNDGQSKVITYSFELMDGSLTEVTFKLHSPSKVFPLGYPEFVDGSYKGAFSKDASVVFEKCSLLLM